MTAGLLKLLYLHAQFTTDEFLECLHLAIEYRQRVHNQLCAMRPGEFQEKVISYDRRSHLAWARYRSERNSPETHSSAPP